MNHTIHPRILLCTLIITVLLFLALLLFAPSVFNNLDLHHTGTVYKGPVSHSPVPPPGVMPFVILNGSPYEMGYQYALQVPEYIAIVRDAAWASALSGKSYEEVLDSVQTSRTYISSELRHFDFMLFFQGVSDAMNVQGIPFTPEDLLVIQSYGARKGPVPDEHCTTFALSDPHNRSSTFAGTNFDYYQVPANSYSVLLALYPDTGISCVIPTGAGRLGSNAVVNDAGLVYLLTSSPADDTGDSGPGITGFLEIPYVGMTAKSVSEAETILLNITRAFALNRLLVDHAGEMEVIEATRKKYAIRSPNSTDTHEYIIATNHYLDPAMNRSQVPWDPEQNYPSSYYRYLTAEKMIREYNQPVNSTFSQDILQSCNWWDGREWHRDDPYSKNTINRFRPDVGSLYSFIAAPGLHQVLVCLGNPGKPWWGTKAPGQTGTYVKMPVGKTPEFLVYQLKNDADARMWETVQDMGHKSFEERENQWLALEEQYWNGVWWQNRGVLEQDQNMKMVAFGKAATNFSYVIAHTEKMRESGV